MVFQKKANKGGKPNQKTQAKKPAKLQEDFDMSDDDFDEDMDSDSDDEPTQVQKTPSNKTPKGRQSLSEKKVSFQVPGKNTPAKTPVKGSLAKKPLTPAKGALKEFEGMKSQKKSKVAEEDDDDDDEDDSDFEAGDLDLDLDDDDLDEEDSDDDEEEEEDDDDDDDDEEDEDEEEVKSKGQKNKQKSDLKNKTPVKAEKKSDVKTPKSAQTPKTPKSQPAEQKKEKQSPIKNAGVVAPAEEIERRMERESRQLFVGNLPADTTGEELKALSKDIKDVHVPQRPNRKFAFAFLNFATEKKAEENFDVLKNKKFRGQPLNVDYVGAKSLNRNRTPKEVNYNLKELQISGLPLTCTIHQVAEYFPTCFKVNFNQSSDFRVATVGFLNEEKATEAFSKNKEIEIGGVKIPVFHSVFTNRKARQSNKRKKGFKKNGLNSPLKKMKMEQGSSDDE